MANEAGGGGKGYKTQESRPTKTNDARINRCHAVKITLATELNYKIRERSLVAKSGSSRSWERLGTRLSCEQTRCHGALDAASCNTQALNIEVQLVSSLAAVVSVAHYSSFQTQH